MWPADALEGWREFYLLVGSAGATLLALLLIAIVNIRNAWDLTLTMVRQHKAD